MSAIGVKTASEKLRQRSASSSVSSSASGGARVRARVEEGDNDSGKCEFMAQGRHYAITQVPLAIRI